MTAPAATQKIPIPRLALSRPATANLMRPSGLILLCQICIAVSIPASIEAKEARSPAYLADMSLEQLANLEITSVSRRGESLTVAPASIFVITAEDIRISGATTLPQALRLAPNLQVARIDANQYAISARGFNTTTANKLLVLIDGRTVYTPLFSGVFWDAQRVVLEDVDRIEVISGPGATLWGTNAVNGVINVITRSSADTTGGMISGGAGDDERGISVRYGDSFSDNGSFRVYGKYQDFDHTSLASGAAAEDEWSIGQIGFRADLGLDKDSYTLLGDAYDGNLDDPGETATTISGANLLGRWSRRLSAQSSMDLQIDVDYTERDIAGVFSEVLTRFDAEFQHVFKPASDHTLTWGGGYRYAWDDVGNTDVLAFLPAEKNLTWGNAFVQDEIGMLDDRLFLTLGLKTEYNSYTRFEFLPSARFAWRLPSNQLLWGAISRAVRSPSRIDTEFFVPGEPPFTIAGGPDFESEVSNVFEIGYRAQPAAYATYAVTLFHSEHDKLRSLEADPAGSFIGNRIGGDSTGVEFTGRFQPTDNWRITAGGVYLNQDLGLEPGSLAVSVRTEGNDPEYHWMLRSDFTLPMDLSLNLWFRGVGALPEPHVPGYVELNARLAWRPYPNLELSLIGKNLLDDGHPEFGAPLTRSEIHRGVRVNVRWNFDVN